jgi:hypothetical protein
MSLLTKQDQTVYLPVSTAAVGSNTAIIQPTISSLPDENNKPHESPRHFSRLEEQSLRQQEFLTASSTFFDGFMPPVLESSTANALPESQPLSSELNSFTNSTLHSNSVAIIDTVHILQQTVAPCHQPQSPVLDNETDVHSTNDPDVNSTSNSFSIAQPNQQQTMSHMLQSNSAIIQPSVSQTELQNSLPIYKMSNLDSNQSMLNQSQQSDSNMLSWQHKVNHPSAVLTATSSTAIKKNKNNATIRNTTWIEPKSIPGLLTLLVFVPATYLFFNK